MAAAGNNDSETPPIPKKNLASDNWQNFAANQPPDLLQNSKNIWPLLAVTKASEKVGKSRQKFFGVLHVYRNCQRRQV